MVEISHCQEWVGVPVDGIVPVIVNTWSESRAVALVEGVPGDVNAELTVTVDEADEV